MAKNIPLDVQLSKALTWLLRHGAEKEGIIMEKGNKIFTTSKKVALS